MKKISETSWGEILALYDAFAQECAWHNIIWDTPEAEEECEQKFIQDGLNGMTELCLTLPETGWHRGDRIEATKETCRRVREAQTEPYADLPLF